MWCVVGGNVVDPYESIEVPSSKYDPVKVDTDPSTEVRSRNSPIPLESSTMTPINPYYNHDPHAHIQMLCFPGDWSGNLMISHDLIIWMTSCMTSIHFMTSEYAGTLPYGMSKIYVWLIRVLENERRFWAALNILRGYSSTLIAGRFIYLFIHLLIYLWPMDCRKILSVWITTSEPLMLRKNMCCMHVV